MKKIQLLAVVLLLAACRPTPMPADVRFPDDPRVLHGTWELQVLSRSTGADFQFDAAAENLVISLLDNDHVRYVREVAGWSEAEGGRPAGTFDSSLDAFVTLQRQDGSMRVRTLDFAGHADESFLDLPAGVSFNRFVIGSGRITGISSSEGSQTRIYWWDAVTGELQGQRSIAHHPDGMVVSSNGRMISFWHLRGGRATLVDTARPHAPLSIRLGVCRANGTGEVSSDGRWFVAGGCMSTLIVYDLQDANPVGRSFSTSPWVQVTMAVDAPEVLWLDESHAIRSLNVETGSSERLHVLQPEERNDTPYLFHPLYLNRSAGLLAFNTHRGFTRLIALADETVTDLPPLELSGVVLDLVATGINGQSPPFAQLGIKGKWIHGSSAFQVTGTVDGGSHHLYQPQGLSPSMGPPPPPALALLSIIDPEAGPEPEDQEIWNLTVQTEDRNSLEYRGVLYANSPDRPYSYSVKLVRP